ncbi:MAG: hypothetical protein LBN00_04220 [Oscillospiraceae bacterium]|jgi:hypothetical protein|nr:hypothetical protein [Oscillospiraceae bacterium]
MKKFILLLIVLALCVGLFACADKTQEPVNTATPTPTAAATSAEPTPTPTITPIETPNITSKQDILDSLSPEELSDLLNAQLEREAEIAEKVQKVTALTGYEPGVKLILIFRVLYEYIDSDTAVAALDTFDLDTLAQFVMVSEKFESDPELNAEAKALLEGEGIFFD